MRAVLSAVSLLLFSFLLAACGVESNAAEVLNTAKDQTHATSYHVTVRWPTYPTHPKDVQGEFRWEVDLQPPDRARVLLFGAESITVGEEAYGRTCGGVGTDCEPWEGPVPVTIASAGPPPFYIPALFYMPGWPLVAAEMAQDLEVIDLEDSDQEGEIHIRGKVNRIRAVLESERRVFAAADITSFGTICESDPVEPEGDYTNDESCRERTFEEYLNGQSHLEFYDENMTVMDVWIGETGLINKIRFQIPPDEHERIEQVVTFEYSEFGEVVIERPV